MSLHESRKAAGAGSVAAPYLLPLPVQSVAAHGQVGFSFEPIPEVVDLLMKRRDPHARFIFRKPRTPPRRGFRCGPLADSRKATPWPGFSRQSHGSPSLPASGVV